MTDKLLSKIRPQRKEGSFSSMPTMFQSKKGAARATIGCTLKNLQASESTASLQARLLLLKNLQDNDELYVQRADMLSMIDQRLH